MARISQTPTQILCFWRFLFFQPVLVAISLLSILKYEVLAQTHSFSSRGSPYLIYRYNLTLPIYVMACSVVHLAFLVTSWPAQVGVSNLTSEIFCMLYLLALSLRLSGLMSALARPRSNGIGLLH